MKKLISLILISFVVSTAHADLAQDGQALCSKIKSCVVTQLEKETLTAEQKAVALGLFDNQCVASVRKYEVALGSAGLEDKARSCLESLTAQNCSALLGGTGPLTTPSCTDFEKSAIEAGINLSQ